MIINVISIDPEVEFKSVNPNIKFSEVKRFREERLLSVIKQSKQFGFPVKFWEGIVDPRGTSYGIVLAFRKIVEYARDANLPRVCIAEDDIIFSSPRSWQYFIDNIPDAYDLFYGGIYSGQVENGRIVNGFSGNTLMIVPENFYDEFILRCDEAILKGDHLDRYLGNFAHQKNYRICEPYICYQLTGYSDRMRRYTQHREFLSDMNLLKD